MRHQFSLFLSSFSLASDLFLFYAFSSSVAAFQCLFAMAFHSRLRYWMNSGFDLIVGSNTGPNPFPSLFSQSWCPSNGPFLMPVYHCKPSSFRSRAISLVRNQSVDDSIPSLMGLIQGRGASVKPNFSGSFSGKRTNSEEVFIWSWFDGNWWVDRNWEMFYYYILSAELMLNKSRRSQYGCYKLIIWLIIKPTMLDWVITSIVTIK